jgi:hypothetical protein
VCDMKRAQKALVREVEWVTTNGCGDSCKGCEQYVFEELNRWCLDEGDDAK